MNRFNKLIRFNRYIYIKFGNGIKSLYLCDILHRFIRWYYHCEIPLCINIENCYFNHKGFGIVINPKTILDKNINIQHCVTIGEKDINKAPHIECNVYIGAKATIIGGITIGHNSIIGAGAVVVKNVPPYSIVVGNPAKVIKSNNPNIKENIIYKPDQR